MPRASISTIVDNCFLPKVGLHKGCSFVLHYLWETPYWHTKRALKRAGSFALQISQVLGDLR